MDNHYKIKQRQIIAYVQVGDAQREENSRKIKNGEYRMWRWVFIKQRDLEDVMSGAAARTGSLR